ncbi:hypothetical protein DXG01_003491 [Tephrocybe rancida]|nr:hypothetical protein DXG01_003491 [Tephrocybe rancida]
MGLHTEPGCSSVNPTQLSTSTQGPTDCSFLANSNSGCLVTDTNTASYGAGFAAAGGGVYVTEFATTGISIWFFARANIPASLKSSTGSVDTSTLGMPSGNWPSKNCTMNQFFEPQNLIFDITLCGDFAGSPSIFAQTCSGTCYPDYVVGNGTNYATAYFEVASVRVYSSDGTNNIIKGGSSTTTNGSSTSTTPGSSPSTPGNGALGLVQNSVLALLASFAMGSMAIFYS